MRVRVEIPGSAPASIVECELAVPAEPITLADLARLVRPLSDAGANWAEHHATRHGEHVACAKGCGACCRQLVTISPAEALMIKELVAALPGEHRQEVEARFAAAKARLQAANLLTPLEQLGDPNLNDAEHYALARDYFQLGLPCPFLDGANACSIHPNRPSLCREYLASSPPAYCADPFTQAIKPLANPLRVGEALTALCARRLGRELQPVPLALALNWAHQHSDAGQKHWPARGLLEEFLIHLDLAVVAASPAENASPGPA